MLNILLLVDSHESVESSTTLLLAGKWDWGEERGEGEPRNAFDGELLTAGHSVDVLC